MHLSQLFVVLYREIKEMSNTIKKIHISNLSIEKDELT